jgi:hypothetical protein
MALHTLGTAATTSLVTLAPWSAVLLDTDVGNVDNMLTSDTRFGSIQGYSPAGPTAIWGTGSTHSNTTLDTLVAVGASAPLSQIKVGYVVLGPSFPAGTFVTQIVSGTSVLLSSNASNTAAGQIVAFVPPDADGSLGGNVSRQGATLTVPNRGRLRILPGDYVAYDPVTGFPILVSGAAVAQAGSVWSYT